MAELRIENLHVSVAGKEILRGVNLTMNEGETVALVGPNGHGKSTLLFAIMGHPNYVVTEGSITLDGQDVLSLSVDERSRLGLFLAMQSPSEIPGVNSSDFLKAALNCRREKTISLYSFYNALQNAYRDIGIPFEMSNRNLNEGFSGGEKKKNEILQLKLLEPRFALLDEIDSGLDVDAIGVVSKAIREEQEKGRGFLVISHYARLYDLIEPSRVAVMVNGRIATKGGPELAKKIDAQGYEWIKTELGIDIEKEQPKVTSIGVCGVKEAIKK